MFGDYVVDELLDDRVFQLFMTYIGVVLGRYDDRFDFMGFAIDVLHRHLGLTVGSEKRKGPVLAAFGQSLRQTVGQIDRQRHQRRRLLAGVSKHQSLIPRTDRSASLIDTLVDIGRLFADSVEHAGGTVVEAVKCIGITDFADHLSGDILHRGVGDGFEFTRYDAESVGEECFACYTGIGIPFYDVIENRIADLIGHFVGMAFGDRFRREKITSWHQLSFKY